MKKVKNVKRQTGTFTVRDLIGEDAYTEIMCQFYGMKYTKDASKVNKKSN